jgi:hypothetical protein
MDLEPPGPEIDCNANFRPVLSSEMVPHIKNQEIYGSVEEKETVW